MATTIFFLIQIYLLCTLGYRAVRPTVTGIVFPILEDNMATTIFFLIQIYLLCTLLRIPFNPISTRHIFLHRFRAAIRGLGVVAREQSSGREFSGRLAHPVQVRGVHPPPRSSAAP